MPIHRETARRIRHEIFAKVVEDIGTRLSGCVICVLACKYGVYVCTSQFIVLATNKTIHNVVRNAFMSMREDVAYEKVLQVPKDHIVDMDKCHRDTSVVLKMLHEVKDLHAMHFCMLYYDAEKLLYRVRNKNFPLDDVALGEMCNDIFKLWSEMHDANAEVGEQLLYDGL